MYYSFKKEYTLKPHSPLIHFQWEQKNAGLRATEVKPKLDKYIKRCAEKDKVTIPENWIIKNSPKQALDYKMSISTVGECKIVELGYLKELKSKSPYDIFHGNMGAEEKKKKKGVIAEHKLTIICFNKELREYINKVIGDFFIVTNFGTMQGKGFGSFTVKGYSDDTEYICNTLKKEYGSEACYRFMTERGKEFKQIKCLYSLMKTGINTKNFYGEQIAYRRSILFDYMHKPGIKIGNEKAWMKQKGIAPSLGKETDQIDKVNRYVRALFGICEAIDFKNSLSNPKDKVKVTIEETSNEIKRLNSPVLFKVINNYVYFIGTEINDEIYGKTFEFSSKNGSGKIEVPTKEELPVNFMDDFMQYAFLKLNEYKRDFIEIKNIRLEEK